MISIDRWDVPEFKAGQSVAFDITWNDDAGPIDLTASWAACTFRSDYGKPEIFTVTSTDGDIVLGSGERNIVVSIPPEKSALLNSGNKQTRGVFDVKVVSPSGSVDFPVGDGRWYCNPTSTTGTP
jgi:hypothetical protein